MEQDNILIVDDEPSVLTALKRVFSDEPITVHSAHNVEEALEILKAQTVKVVISDERMPFIAGSEFLSIVRQKYPRTIRIILTGQADIESAIRAINSGEIYKYFRKPWNDEEIIKAVRLAIARYNAHVA